MINRRRHMPLEEHRTYPKNSRVVRNLWRFWLFILRLVLSKIDILHIATTENDIFIDAGGRWNFLGCVPTSTFGAVRYDIFECDCRSLGIDIMEGPDVAANALAIASYSQENRRIVTNRISLLEIKLKRRLAFYVSSKRSTLLHRHGYLEATYPMKWFISILF